MYCCCEVVEVKVAEMNRTLPSKERIAQEIETYFSKINPTSAPTTERDLFQYSSFHNLRKYLEAIFVISLESLEEDIKRAIFLSKNFHKNYLNLLPSQSYSISMTHHLIACHGSAIIQQTNQSLILPLFHPYFILEFHHQLIVKSISMNILPALGMEISIQDCDHMGDNISLILQPQQQGAITDDRRKEV